MNKKAWDFIKNVIYAVSANVSRILTTLILTLVLPRLMTVEDYSYWQLYCFYGVYLAYSSLGWCEGTYLKYAGKTSDELDGQKMSAQFWLLCIYEILFCVLFFLVFYPKMGGNLKGIALTLALGYTWMQILRFQLQTILQATNQISAYARVYSGERILNFLFVIGCMAAGCRNFWMVAGAELLSNLCMTVYAFFLCRKVIWHKPQALPAAFRESKELIAIGCKLSLAGLASQLVIGVVRFGIEQKWGTIVFGKISLSFSMANMMITCISAVSIVLFPVLRKYDVRKLENIYAPVRTILTVPLFGMLLVYLPVRFFLERWIPHYMDSLKYLAILFPLCVYETRNTVLVWTYLKTIRREQDIMKANLVTVVFSVIMTVLSVFVMGSLDWAVVSIIVLYAMKSFYTEYLLGRHMKIFERKKLVAEVLLTVVFVLSSWVLQGISAFLVYLAVYLLYAAAERKEIVSSAAEMKRMLKGQQDVTME